MTQAGAVALITAMIGYAIGFLTTHREQETYERRLYLEQRMKLFVSTANNFTGYIENFHRLNTFVGYQRTLKRKLNAEEQERLTRYERDRTSARERLWVDLEQAKLMYGDDVGLQIKDFKNFFEKSRDKELHELPSRGEYEIHKDRVLESMRNEVKGGESEKADINCVWRFCIRNSVGDR